MGLLGYPHSGRAEVASVEGLMNEDMHVILRAALVPLFGLSAAMEDTASGVRSYFSSMLKKGGSANVMFADPPLFFQATNSVSLLYIPLAETQPFFRNL